MYNSFYGAKFTEDNECHIDNKEKYSNFKNEKLWNIENYEGVSVIKTRVKRFRHFS